MHYCIYAANITNGYGDKQLSNASSVRHLIHESNIHTYSTHPHQIVQQNPPQFTVKKKMGHGIPTYNASHLYHAKHTLSGPSCTEY